VVASATRPHRLSLPRPGWAEHDAEAIWWADLVALCRELLVDDRAARLRGVCVSGIGPVLLAADADGRPLRPAILYGIDSRAGREIEELDRGLGAEAILARGGSPLTSQAVGPKLLWLRRHEPEVWERTRQFLMASSFAVRRLTGEYVLDHHSASQCDPLYDIRELGWIPEWAERIAPGLELPRLLWPGEVAGAVSDEGAAATGIPAGTPVAAGTVDAWAEALGAGVSVPGQTMLMYGSTMFLVQPTREPAPTKRLWCTVGVEPGTWSLAGGMATSGSVTDWLRGLTGLDFDELQAEARESPPGANGLLMLPYFAGERTPYFDPRARGVIAGLTLAHTRGDLFRAALEATAYGVRQHLELFADLGADPAELTAVGGGTAGGLWTQIVSDVSGREQLQPQVTIGAAYGDALLAARAVGLAGPGESWARAAEVVRPAAAPRPIYDRIYREYQHLYGSSIETAHTLADLQDTASPKDF
jgi:xylulokinase